MNLVLVFVLASASYVAMVSATASTATSATSYGLLESGHNLAWRTCARKISRETRSSVLANVSSKNGKKLPNTLIIGAAKAGTTALLRMLELHPDVAIPEDCEELEFFSNAKRYRRGLNWYRSLMPENSRTKRIVLEKTAEYFIHPAVPSRVHEFNSSIKLILLVRDPVQRAISHYTMQTKEGCSLLHWSVPDRCERRNPTFEDIFPEPDFQTWKPVQGPEVKEGYNWIRNELIQPGLYAHYLREWLGYFSREQILILDGDLLLVNPAPVVREACGFLGLDSNWISDEVFYFNETKGKYCWTLPAGQDADGADQDQPTCLPSHKGINHTPIAKETLKKWARFFAPKNEEFFRLIGRRFPNWGNKC